MYTLCTFLLLTDDLNNGDSGSATTVVNLDIFESVGVDTTPTDGIPAILAAKHPITAPPPIDPTIRSGFIFLYKLKASKTAWIVLNPPFIMVSLVAACPPAWGIFVSCHFMPCFSNNNPFAP